MTFGIDLGTSKSAIAVVEDGHFTPIPNRQSEWCTPSVIGWGTNNNLLIGQAAKNQLLTSPARTIANFKRRFGGRMLIETDLGGYSPEEIAYVLLRRLRQDAGEWSGEPVAHAVITVPAHFGAGARSATVESALAAGFQRVHLLNEPTAAVVPYLEAGAIGGRVLVFDFGGGTTDITAMERDARGLLVRSTVGNGRLGGLDLDAAILRGLLKDGRIPPELAEGSLVTRARLNAAVERLKIELSYRQQTNLVMPFVHGAGKHIELTVSRQEVEAWTRPHVSTAVQMAQNALREAGFGVRGTEHIVLAGGSSRIPLVRRLLREHIPGTVLDDYDPVQVVLMGAAVFAGWLDQGASSSVREVLGSTVAIETENDACVPFVPRNVSLPVIRRRRFTTVEERQGFADIHVVQGESSTASKNRSLARLSLSDIRHGADGREPEITVTVKIDEGGLLSVAASESGGGATASAHGIAWNAPPGRPLECDPRRYLMALRRRLRRILKSLNAGPHVVTELAVLVDVADRALARASGELQRDISDSIMLIESTIEQIVHDRSKGWSKGASN